MNIETLGDCCLYTVIRVFGCNGIVTVVDRRVCTYIDVVTVHSITTKVFY